MSTTAKSISKSASFSALLLLSNLAMVLASGITGAEILQEGTWNGTYTFSESPHSAQFIVTNSTPGEETITDIKMILAELELIYDIKNVQLSGNRLSFTILKRNEKQICTLLKQENQKYVGTCKSDADSAGVILNDIFMAPPNE